MSDASAGPNQFLLTEYDALCRRLEVFTREQFILARWALIFTAVFWAALAITQAGWLPELAYWTPAIFVGFLGIRSLSLLMAVRRMQTYLLSVESSVALPEVLGWEKMRQRQRTTAIKVLCLFYWLGLLALNIFLAAVYIPCLQ